MLGANQAQIPKVCGTNSMKNLIMKNNLIMIIVISNQKSEKEKKKKKRKRQN